MQRLRALGVPVDVLDETDDEVAVRELVAWLRREEIDLVHAHMFRAEVIGTRAAVAAGTAVDRGDRPLVARPIGRRHPAPGVAHARRWTG